MVVSLLGWWARWCRCSLASPLAAASCVYFFFYPYLLALAAFVGPCVCGYTSCSLCAPGFVVCVFVVAVVCCPAACGSLLSVLCRFPFIPCFFMCRRPRVKRV